MKIIESYSYCQLFTFCHPAPFAPCHSTPFTPCHSERSEESNPAQGKLREESRSGQAPRPKNPAQDKLREAIPSYRLLRRYAPRNDNGK